ncbi:hypothetical protein ANCCAN_17618 [Ancylostoma caninum]|uniref:DDE Tnp4 domain-containing protein n=1 Tax=Ancylostoma caninum TaxID=29170 RepID=A0A368G1M7_ANCCA|nr:hypothetical protein ANCCAN_17618 [Ancylostoma caninum]
MEERHLKRLCDLLRPIMGRAEIAHWSVEHENKVLIGLRYLASDSHQEVLADTMGVCQKTVSNAVTEFIEALNHPLIVKKFINCNLGDERFCCSHVAGFARRGLLPNIVGAMDGTYVRMLKPPHSESQYYCRKPFCALNVLAVVDARGRFTYVNANFSGSLHDSAVYSLSKLREAFEEGRVPRRFCLLGDSGFNNGSDILPPIWSPRTRQQRRYNKTHKKMRVIVECTFGRWKGRFKILESEVWL